MGGVEWEDGACGRGGAQGCGGGGLFLICIMACLYWRFVCLGDSSYGQVVDVYEGLLLQVERGKQYAVWVYLSLFYSGKSFKRHVR